jgi:hypothetical protein
LKDAGGALSGSASDVVQEIQSRILGRFADATFNARVGPDGRVYLAVYSEATQDFEIQDLVADRTVDAIIAGDVKIHVFPRRKPEAPSARPPSHP